MKKLETLEQFFETLLEQSEDTQERIALHLVKDGHIIPEKLIGLTWKDIDLKSKTFYSTNFLGRFSVPMSEELFNKIKDYQTEISANGRFFQNTEKIDHLLMLAIEKLANQPHLKEKIDKLYITPPNAIVQECLQIFSHYLKKRQVSYFAYIESIAHYFGKQKETILWAHLIIQDKTTEIPLLKWQDISIDGSKIHIPLTEINIEIPNELHDYLKEVRKTTPLEEFIFPQNRTIDTILKKADYLFLLLINLNRKSFFNPQTLQKKINELIIPAPDRHQTRDCLSAWNQKEITTTGEVKPCCVLPDFMFKMSEENDSEQVYKNLRSSLLNGTLNHHCATCYLTKPIKKEKLRQKIEHRQTQNNQSDKLADLPTDHLAFYISTKCNLRCTYCTVSNEGYVGLYMKDETFEQCLSLANQASEQATIELIGLGEVTYHPSWRTYMKETLKTGKKLTLTTNLASKYSEEDYQLLAQLHCIGVSLDSHDEEMMVTIRKKIKPKVVFERIRKIQEAAKVLNINGPIIKINIGVYNPSIWKMDDYVEEITKLKIHGLNFWQLRKVTDCNMTSSITELNKQDTQKAREIFHRAITTAKKEGLEIGIPHDLVCNDGLPLYQENLISQTNEQPKKKLSLFQRLLGNSVTKKQ